MEIIKFLTQLKNNKYITLNQLEYDINQLKNIVDNPKLKFDYVKTKSLKNYINDLKSSVDNGTQKLKQAASEAYKTISKIKANFQPNSDDDIYLILGFLLCLNDDEIDLFSQYDDDETLALIGMLLLNYEFRPHFSPETEKIIETVNNEFEQLKIENAKLLQSIQELSSAKQQSNNNLSAANLKQTMFEGQLLDLKRQIVKCSILAYSANAEKNNFERLMKETEDRLQESQKKLKNSESNTKFAKAKHTGITNRLRTRNADFEKRNAELNRLLAQSNALVEAAGQQLRATEDAAAEAASDAQATAEEAAADAEAAQEHITLQEAKIARLKGQLVAAQAARDAAEAARDRAADAAKAAEDARADVDAARADVDAARDAAEQARTEAAQAQVDTAIAEQRKAEEAQAAAEEAKAAAEEAQAAAEEAQAAAEEAQAAAEEAQAAAEERTRVVEADLENEKSKLLLQNAQHAKAILELQTIITGSNHALDNEIVQSENSANIERLKEELRANFIQLKQKSQENGEISLQLQSVNAALHDARAQFKDNTAKVNVLEEKIAELSHQNEAHIQELYHNLEAEQEKNAKYELIIAEMRPKLEKYLATNTKLTTMLEERDISIGSLSANIDILTREIDKITEGKEQLHEKIRVLGEQNKALFSEISKLLVKKQGDEDAALQFILNFDNKKVRDRQYEDELNAANKTLEDLNRKQYSTIEGLEDQLKHVKKNNEVFIKSILDYDLIPRLNRIELVEQFRTIFKL